MGGQTAALGLHVDHFMWPASTGRNSYTSLIVLIK